MKKSTIYKVVQMLMLDYDCGGIASEDKLEILRELMMQEDLAKFAEEQEAKKNEG